MAPSGPVSGQPVPAFVIGGPSTTTATDVTVVNRTTLDGAPVAATLLAGDGHPAIAMVATVDPDDVSSLVSRLQEALDAAGTPCSAGAAPVGVVTGFAEAIAVADAAMYDDKRARRGPHRAGGGPVVVDPPRSTPYAPEGS